MSVVVYDGKTLAADTLAISAGLGFKVSKMLISDGTACAWTGDHALGIRLAQWYFDGADPATFPNKDIKDDEWCRLIVADQYGCEFYEVQPVPIRVLDPFAAWGSGRDFALGALAMGASAKEAVEVACRFSIECGGAPQVIVLE